MKIGGRAADLLHILLDRAGEVVGRADLQAFVWPGAELHESNLKVTISALRRTLAQPPDEAPLIVTSTGRGYRFAADVEVRASSTAAGYSATNIPSGILPPAPDLIGRTGAVEKLETRIAAHRLVTITGPAGVGKTSVALVAANRCAARFPDGVHFVDLAAVGDPALVAPTVGRVLGVPGGAIDMLREIKDALCARRILILLDNCEHVLNAAAVLAEHILASAPEAHILATSRAGLRLQAEAIVRLAPLTCPPDDAVLGAAEALTYSAVQLLVRRGATRGAFQLTDANAAAAARLCRRLDGVALAVELAAAQLPGTGVEALLDALEQSFDLLSFGRRAAAPRHRSLLATLDWSYGLLSPFDARLLRRLSVFAGAFSIEDALGVGCDDRTGVEEAAAGLRRLVDGSLVAESFPGDRPRYRLLEATRAFAATALQDAGEVRGAYGRYADRLVDVLERAAVEWQWRERADWTGAYAPRVHDLRKALDWAFGPEGAPPTGIRLTVAGIPLWDELSAVEESRARVSIALGALAASGEANTVARMKLMTAHAASLNFSSHLGPDADVAWSASLGFATGLKDVDYQLRALWGQAVLRSFTGRHWLALESLDDFMGLAERRHELSALPDGRRLTLMTRLYLGDIQDGVAGLAEQEAAQTRITSQTRMSRFQVDRLVGLRVALGWARWLSGDYAAATRLASSALERAHDLDHRVSQSNALAHIALPLAIQGGDLAQGRRYAAQLERTLAQENIPIWRPVSRFLAAAIEAAAGTSSAVDDMRASLDELVACNFLIRTPFYFAMLAGAALDHDRTDLARTAIQHALKRVEAQAERWCWPELLRVQARTLARAGERHDAHRLLHQAHHAAVAMGARTWQLRAATDLVEVSAPDALRIFAVRALQQSLDQMPGEVPNSDLRRAQDVLATFRTPED